MHKYQFQILYGILIGALAIIGIWYNFIYLKHVNGALIATILFYILIAYYGYKGYFWYLRWQGRQNHFQTEKNWRAKKEMPLRRR